MEKSMFFFDFDDTLFSHTTKCVFPGTCAALRRLEENGHIVVIATGRGREAVQLVERELGWLPNTLIVLNGQVVFEKGEVVYENHMALGSVGRLAEAAGQNGAVYGGYYWNGIVASGLNTRVRQVWGDFGQELPLVCAGFENTHEVYQGQLYITKEEQPLFADVLDEYVTNWSHEFLVNLIPKTAGKSQAVRWCIRHYGIPRENTYAFGDGFNDVDMMEAVCHGVAMGNSTSAELKQKAEYITAASHENGVCMALEHYGF